MRRKAASIGRDADTGVDSVISLQFISRRRNIWMKVLRGEEKI